MISIRPATFATLTSSLLAIAGFYAPVRAAAPLELESSDGMVVTAQHAASEVGAAILRQGGNAVDAAVAVGYALAVTHPCCGNLGGGGFMLIHLKDGKNAFINFRERAPLAATAGMYLDAKGDPIADKSLNGWLAVGTPGTVMGLETAREEYGTMPRAALIAPAIALADNGFVLDPSEVKVIEGGVAAAPVGPAGATVRAVFTNHGKPFVAGDR